MVKINLNYRKACLRQREQLVPPKVSAHLPDYTMS
jgi:hypothetical protein